MDPADGHRRACGFREMAHVLFFLAVAAGAPSARETQYEAKPNKSRSLVFALQLDDCMVVVFCSSGSVGSIIRLDVQRQNVTGPWILALAVLSSVFLWTTACVAGRAEVSWTESAPVLERSAEVNELLAHPEDNKMVGINPPGFYWTPLDSAKAYRLEIRKIGAASGNEISAQPVKSTAYALPHTLEPGEYLWHIVYLDSSGKAYGVSKSRRFRLALGLPSLPMPDTQQLKARLATIRRPRLFLGGGREERIRLAVRNNSVTYSQVFMETANAVLGEKSYPEPSPTPDGKPTAADWRRIFTPAKLGSAHLARTALAYRLTGDRKYLDAAKRWMLTLASWNPRGITSHGLRQPDGTEGVDEASMPMLERMSLAWDWMGDQLSPEERARVLASIKERGNQVLELLEEKDDFLSHPYSNHGGRVLAFLGLAGLSVSG